MREWRDADMARIRELRGQGMTWPEVGEEFDVSGDTARKAYSRNADGPMPPRGERELSQPPRTPPRFTDWVQPEEVDWRETFDAFDNTLSLHERLDPTQEFLTVDLSRHAEPVAIAFSGDWHIGGGYTSHQRLRALIELVVTEPNLYLGVVGDTIEGFLPGIHKSAETIEQMVGSIKAQLGALSSIVTELCEAGKLLWMCWGDHDAKWFEKLVGVNVVKLAVHDQTPYFTGRGLVTLKLADQTYYIMANHSERFSSQWNKTHAARRQYEQFFPADVNVTAHKHKPAFMMDHHYEALREAGLPVGGKHWLVQVGTYKTGPDPYTIRSWSKGVPGVPTAVFQPHHHDVDMFEGPRKALAYLRGLEAAA